MARTLAGTVKEILGSAQVPTYILYTMFPKEKTPVLHIVIDEQGWLSAWGMRPDIQKLAATRCHLFWNVI